MIKKNNNTLVEVDGYNYTAKAKVAKRPKGLIKSGAKAKVPNLILNANVCGKYGDCTRTISGKRDATEVAISLYIFTLLDKEYSVILEAAHFTEIRKFSKLSSKLEIEKKIRLMASRTLNSLSAFTAEDTRLFDVKSKWTPSEKELTRDNDGIGFIDGKPVAAEKIQLVATDATKRYVKAAFKVIPITIDFLKYVATCEKDKANVLFYFLGNRLGNGVKMDTIIKVCGIDTRKNGVPKTRAKIHAYLKEFTLTECVPISEILYNETTDIFYKSDTKIIGNEAKKLLKN